MAESKLVRYDSTLLGHTLYTKGVVACYYRQCTLSKKTKLHIIIYVHNTHT